MGVDYKHHVFWLLPMAVSGLLLLAMHFDIPGRIDVDSSRFALPSVYRMSEGQLDLRLSMSEGLHHDVVTIASRVVSDDLPVINDDDKALINPSFVFSGDSLVIAVHQHSLHTRHSNESHWVEANLSRRTVMVVESTWHSRILMGRSSDAKALGWDDILDTGEAPRFPPLLDWSGLRVNASSSHPWKDLCIRKRYIQKNHTLMLLRVTGPQDPKLMLVVNNINCTKNLPTPHYLSFMHVVDLSIKRYAHFAYRFSAEPPFEILQVSKQLQLGVQSPQGGGSEFAFLSGAALRNQQICTNTGGSESRTWCGTGISMQNACEAKGCCWVDAKKACFEKVSEPAVIIGYSAGDSETRAMVITLARLDELFEGS